MAEHLKGMKNAVMGEGGGLQSVSTDVGNTIAENTDMRGSSSKSADDASTSIGQLGGSKQGQTQAGTPIKAADQVTNQQTGTADHLNMKGS